MVRLSALALAAAAAAAAVGRGAAFVPSTAVPHRATTSLPPAPSATALDAAPSLFIY